MISESLRQLINEFQTQPGLDPSTTLEADMHDSVHAMTGLGISLRDEEIVLNITEVLSGGECLPHNQERVNNFIELMIIADIELFTEIANYFSN